MTPGFSGIKIQQQEIIRLISQLVAIRIFISTAGGCVYGLSLTI